MDDDGMDTLSRRAINDALKVARADGRRYLVGLEELPDGTGRFGYVPEANAPLNFMAGWLVTPGGDVVACVATATN